MKLFTVLATVLAVSLMSGPSSAVDPLRVCTSMKELTAAISIARQNGMARADVQRLIQEEPSMLPISEAIVELVFSAPAQNTARARLDTANQLGAVVFGLCWTQLNP